MSRVVGDASDADDEEHYQQDAYSQGLRSNADYQGMDEERANHRAHQQADADERRLGNEQHDGAHYFDSAREIAEPLPKPDVVENE